jgi:hypothetical protein
MNSRDFAEIGLDLSNPNVWGRKVLDKVVDKLEFVNLASEGTKGFTRFAQIAKFEFDTGEREAQIEITLDVGYFEVSCWFADGIAWCLGFNQIDDLKGPDRLS